jgi:type I restriction enzyme M protein
VLSRREERADFFGREDELFTVLTVSQNGDIRRRPEAKGNNPPEWRGSYFQDSPGDWYVTHAGDIVYSSIDLWKGCISVVPDAFEGALVSKEFPIYRVADDRLSSSFLQTLLRSRFYQRAFRAITTGHSNRRRTQRFDFEELEIAFPSQPADQEELTRGIRDAKQAIEHAQDLLRRAMMSFSDRIDGRGEEELPEIENDEEAD